MKYAHKILKGIRLPGIIYRLMHHIAFQKKFLHQHISPILADAFKNNDGSLDEKDSAKINRYYGLAVPAVLGEAFCALRGSRMRDDERWASTSQGAMTGLFDDFFDKDYMTDAAIEKMLMPGNESTIVKSNQQLFELFYKKALQHVPDKKLMQHSLKEVYKAQVESKKQTADSINQQELTEITFLKGGSSLVFYRTAFSPAASAKEITLLYNLGGLMQLSNDIFDVYKDRGSGIKTLVTETNSIKELQQFFKTGLAAYYAGAFETGFAKKNVQEFLDILSIGIFSRCFVCLDQLENNEKITGGIFRVHEYSRQQLICDMDKKRNMLRSAWAHINEMP